MNPEAREFVPSWLAAPPEQSDESAEPHQAAWDEEPTDATPASTSKNVPSASAAQSAEPSAPTLQDATNDETRADATPSPLSDPIQPSGKTPQSDKRPTSNPSNLTSPLTTHASNATSSSSRTDSRDYSAAVDVLERDLGNVNFDDKKPLNVVLLGHVDAGKSTISGHLLVLTGNVDDRTMEKFEREAKALNRESWKFAFALDTSEQERAKGKTEECGQASFTTPTRRFTILDAPGHKNYVPHMIGGASQADIGILVISARKGEFETGFERGGQTREHAMLAKTAGVRQMVIVINKLDDPSVLNPDGTWSKDRFDECKTKLEPYMKQVGWNPKGLVWIPVSGLTGHNLKVKVPPATCPWYSDDSLLDTLEHIRIPDRLLSGSVKMPINEKHKEMGTMVMGKLESGVIQSNDKLTLMPNRVDVVVDALMLEGTSSQAAEPGDVVRLRLKGVEEEDVRVGFVLCSPRDLVSYSRSFTAKLMILEHKSIICAGYSAVIHIHAAVEEITVAKLLAEIDKKTGKPKQKYPKFVKPGMKVLAQLTTALPICLEPYDVFPQLGRFMIRDEGKTIAVGTVAKVKSMGADSSHGDSSRSEAQ